MNYIEQKTLTKLAEAIEEAGFRMVAFTIAGRGRATLEIGKPVFVNNRGEPIDPATGEMIPQI